MRFPFFLESKDLFTSLVVPLPPSQQGIGQCRILAEDAAIDRGESLRCLPVRSFLGEHDDELLEPLALGLAQRDPAVLPIAPST